MLCRHDCPCDAPKQPLWSQQEPSRRTGEVKETEVFARKSKMVERRISA